MNGNYGNRQIFIGKGTAGFGSGFPNDWKRPAGFSSGFPNVWKRAAGFGSGSRNGWKRAAGLGSGFKNDGGRTGSGDSRLPHLSPIPLRPSIP